MNHTPKTLLNVAPLQEHSDPMEALARELNAQLADDFPNAKLRWPHRRGPVEHAGLLAREAGDVAAQMRDLTTELLGLAPPSADQPHATKLPAGVLPKVAAMEDVATQQLAVIRQLIDHIRQNL